MKKLILFAFIFALSALYVTESAGYSADKPAYVTEQTAALNATAGCASFL